MIVSFSDCDFTNVDLSRSAYAGTAFRNCLLRRTALWHSTFRYCEGLRLEESDRRGG